MTGATTRVGCQLVLAAMVLLAAQPLTRAGAGAQRTSRPTRILLLYAPPPESPGITAFTRQLRVTVRNNTQSPVEFYEESLDLDRFPGRERWPQLARYFAEKYRGFQLDVIVAVGSVALQFATDRLSSLLPGAPVVFALAIPHTVDVAALPANVTGRLTPLPYDSILAMARRLQPDAKRIVVIGGVSTSDSAAVSAAVSAAARFRDRVQLVVLRGLAYDAMLSELRRLPRQTIVLLAYFRRDVRGQVFSTSDIVPAVARASSAPVYGHLRNWVGNGIVGGDVIRVDDEGTRTGQLMLRVLRRRPGEPMPPLEVAGTTFVADWRELRRWGLSERLLPPNTEILFREPTTWERHRAPILIASGLFVAQSLLIGLLLLERRKRIRAQLAVEDQAAYEQTIAELTTDAARHAPDEAPGALEDALARVGRYAGARAAVLTEYPEAPMRPPRRLTWTSQRANGNGNGDAAAAPAAFVDGDSRLDIALVADGAPIGALELYSATRGSGWPERLIGRLDAAGELIASAMARARAARAIRQGEELNRAVLASVSTQIAILDRTGTIIRVNEAWREFARSAGIESDRDGFVGDNYLDQCRRAEDRGCEDARDIRQGIESVLERRAWPFRREYHTSAPDERWYELCVDRLDHVAGGAIVTHLDITDRHLAELKAEETRRQIAHLGRVAMVGELAAAISHELRQPLAAIRANAEAGALLLRQIPPEVAEAQEIFMDIVVDDVRASEIIDRIRTLLRKEEPTTTTVDLNEICRNAVHLLQRDARIRGTRLELVLDPALPAIAGDPVQLQQVVLNLTLNALDASAALVGDREVRIATAARSAEVEIAVRDNGLGLPPDVEKHLFESFFSTKEQGLGMGLVIARSIVERHHGRVRAENDPAGGAVFRVLLPVRPREVGSGKRDA